MFERMFEALKAFVIFAWNLVLDLFLSFVDAILSVIVSYFPSFSANAETFREYTHLANYFLPLDYAFALFSAWVLYQVSLLILKIVMFCIPGTGR